MSGFEIVPFNMPSITSEELCYVERSMKSGKLSGGGQYTEKAQCLLESLLGGECNVLLTTSCTHALEISAILLELQPGDEVIVPAFTFPSTALAFVMHGANIVFADIRSDTLNIDENLLENLITPKTRAIVLVHYAGVACEMDKIMEIANLYDLIVIEDNAHGLFGKYKGKALGTIGHLACQSFHETKNISCGEGGALVINDKVFVERAEVILEKGTNRKRFFRGHVDKYNWVDKGSSYVLADLLAALLYAQLKRANEIQQSRKKVWQYYFDNLKEWAVRNSIKVPDVPAHSEQAFHMFFLLTPCKKSRDRMLSFLNDNGVFAVFHYLPLDRSPMGLKVTNQIQQCELAKKYSDRIIRLPFFTDIKIEQQDKIINTILSYEF